MAKYVYPIFKEHQITTHDVEMYHHAALHPILKEHPLAQYQPTTFPSSQISAHAVVGELLCND